MVQIRLALLWLQNARDGGVAMPPLKNPRHEKFALAVASGKTQSDAYREVYPASRRWKDKSVHEKASAFMVKVKPRVQELQQAVADQVVMTKAEGLSLMAAALRTPIGDIDDRSLLCQEYLVKDDTVMVKMISKISAFQELAKSLGWYAPEKTDHTLRFKPDEKVINLLEDD